MTHSERLLNEALTLPEPERAELVAKLFASLDGPPDSGVDAAWAVEIERRCAALDSGDAISSDWHEVRGRIEREMFGR